MIVTTAPRRPVAPRQLLRLAYSGPPIVETPAERIARVLRIITERCAGALSEADLSLVIKAKAKSGVKPAGK